MANKRNLNRIRRRLRFELDGSTGFTQDISPGGFCAELMKVQRPGTLVSGKLLGDEQEFTFSGVVRWAVASEPKIQRRGRMGIQFTTIGNEFFSYYMKRFGEK